jgi:hypothetical protein
VEGGAPLAEQHSRVQLGRAEGVYARFEAIAEALRRHLKVTAERRPLREKGFDRIELASQRSLKGARVLANA